MTKVSRKPLPKEDWEEFYDQICKALTLLETKQDIREFLDDLLTYTEKKMFSKRVQIARSLQLGLTYDLISKRLNVTDGTIASVNEVLDSRGRGYAEVNKILNDLEKDKIEKLKNSIKRSEYPSHPRSRTNLGKSIRDVVRVIDKRPKRSRRIKSVTT